MGQGVPRISLLPRRVKRINRTIMTHRDKLTKPTVQPASLSERMVQGAWIALALIQLFLLQTGEPDPAWGQLWVVRPLLVVPLAGAVGGAFYYLMEPVRYEGGWRKVLANLLSLVVYVVMLWLGTVLGLVGTMWN